MNLIGADQFRSAARAKRKPDGGVFRVTIAEPKAYDDNSRKVRFCFSDGSVDRMGDTIDPAGWNYSAFEKNPVALWAHDSSAPPIGRASRLMVEDLRLMGDIEFVPAETYAFADTIYRLVLGKFLNAVSVGFLPIEYGWSDDDEREWGLDFKRQELLEISVCPVPANSNALAEARAKGIDTRPLVEWAERTLEGGGKIIIPRAELERLRKAAKEPPTMARRATKPVRRDDGLAEDDPAAGGAAVGNCGRPGDSECGMKDVSECSIHGQSGGGVDDTDEDKKLAAMIARAVSKAVAKAMVVAKIAPAPRRRAEGEDDNQEAGRPDMSDEHENCVRMAHMHMKAMGAALDVAGDHFDNAMDQLDTVKDAMDAAPPSDDGLSGSDDPEGEKAAATRLKKAQDRRKRLGLD